MKKNDKSVFYCEPVAGIFLINHITFIEEFSKTKLKL